MPEDRNVSHWIDLIKEGDSVAADQIWHHYFDRLVRAVRQKLGIDFGRFDFVLYEGHAVLIDANKTPARPSGLEEVLVRGAAEFADGLEQLLP